MLSDEDPVTLEALGGFHRARDRTLDPMLDLRQLVDEEIRRRAGTDADDLVVDHVPDRFAGDGLLQFVLGHLEARGTKTRIVSARGFLCRSADGFHTVSGEN